MSGRKARGAGARGHMALAISKAKEGVRKGDSPFGACIVKGGRVIAVAHNTVLAKKDATNHAEMNAIRLACKKIGSHKLDGCTIYSTTEPCPMCFSAIHWAGAKAVVFGTGIRDVRRLGFNELSISNRKIRREGHSDVSSRGGFMKAECLGLLEFWRNNKKRRTY